MIPELFATQRTLPPGSQLYDEIHAVAQIQGSGLSFDQFETLVIKEPVKGANESIQFCQQPKFG